MTSIVDLRSLTYHWPGQPNVLDIDAFSIAPGERLFLRGPSGSGKSTLLGLISGVLEASSGNLSVFDQDLTRLSGSGRDRLRADKMGVIFQLFNLVPYLSVVQNITLPCKFSKSRLAAVKDAGGAETEAKRLLARLGIDDPEMLARRVTDLSIGQQQRVAAARALIGGPSLIIADEPTSALDADARDRFISLLIEEAASTGAALLFVSHDQSLAPHFERAVDLTELNNAHSRMESA